MEEKPFSLWYSARKVAKTIYEHQSQNHMHLLQQSFFNIEYKEGGTAEFFSVIEEIKMLKQMSKEIINVHVTSRVFKTE